MIGDNLTDQLAAKEQKVNFFLKKSISIHSNKKYT